MTHTPEQTPSITKALVDLAAANGLIHKHHCQYVDSKGNELTQTELGYVCTEYFNYKLKCGELNEDINELKSELNALKGEKRKLVTQNKEISSKTLFKITTILNEKISDKEKVVEIKKYLNV